MLELFKVTIGIYKIKNKINGKLYIGQSVYIEHRFSEHKRKCKENKYNNHFYNALKKHGIENFEFTIIEKCSKQNLNNREQYWIKFYNSNNSQYGYNKTTGGDSNYKRTSDTKKKISESAKLKFKNPEIKEKYIQALKQKLKDDDEYYMLVAQNAATLKSRQIKSKTKKSFWEKEDNKEKVKNCIQEKWKDAKYRKLVLKQRQLASNSNIQLTYNDEIFIFKTTSECAKWCIDKNISNSKIDTITSAIRAHMRKNSRAFMGKNIQIRRIPKIL